MGGGGGLGDVSSDSFSCRTFKGHNVEVKFWAVDIGDKLWKTSLVFVSNPKLEIFSIPLSSQG